MAKRTGISIDTLRYYERIGLIEPIGRAQSGHRRYMQHDLDWIDLLIGLRSTGMPRAQMVRIAQLRRQGFTATLTERRFIYEQYQHTLQQHMQQLEQHMTTVQHKIARLKELEAQQEAASDPADAQRRSGGAWQLFRPPECRN